jgi:arginyl-tRNA synthetase
MSFTELQHRLRGAVSRTASEAFGIDLSAPVAEVPPNVAMGDLAFPAAFELAKRLKASTGEKRNPREIAEQLKSSLESEPLVARAEVAGAGYLNVFFDRAAFLETVRSPRPPAAPSVAEPKMMVEHTSVNPNKAAHIGHVRNSVLGDTFVRILRALGHRTEVQNYIDNTGVQVADVVLGFLFLEEMDLAAIKKLDSDLAAKGRTFDYYCWDLYARVGQAYQTDEALKLKRAEVLHLIEEGANPTAELADYVATRNVACILDTMERLSIRYDLLPRESEILHLDFWKRAFEKMKDLGVIRLETSGKNSGCWVMPFDSHEGTDEHDADKILVRSNGTVTYTGKDIAYQLWKLGELGLDFRYRRFSRYPDGADVWVTTSGEGEEHPRFGGGHTVFNVIDTRQSYPQEVVKKGVSLIAPNRGEAASVHLSYEMVALSPSAAEELGFALSDDDRAKSFIEMSGRKGLGVKADDLLNRLEENALAEVAKRHPDAPDSERRSIARIVAVGALRYFLLKFTRNTVVVFDFGEALSFEGETGVYCQYTAVRINSIFRKLGEDSIPAAAATVAENRDSITGHMSRHDDVWELITLASRLDETLSAAKTQLEPAILAKYAFALCKAFNLFYHNHKIVTEDNPAWRAVLVLTAALARDTVNSALATLGIDVPERM